MAVAVKKTAQGQNATVIRTLAFQAIKNAVIAILARRPTGFQRTIATHPVTTRLGFTKRQDNVQVVFPALYIARREPEILADKMIQVWLRRQQQG